MKQGIAVHRRTAGKNIPILWGLVAACLYFNTFATGAHAQDWNYLIRQSLPLPESLPENSLVQTVQDMDGDGVLDTVILVWPNIILFTELEGDGFVTRAQMSFDGEFRMRPVTGDVNGNGIPELMVTVTKGDSKNWALIYEATADNTYTLLDTVGLSGLKVEKSYSGDSDGDGLLEFLICMEVYPAEDTRVHIIEATGSDFFSVGTLNGEGGNCFFAGVADLNANGVPDLVFSDDDYDYVYDPISRKWIRHDHGLGRLYIFENRQVALNAPGADMESTSIGDTDGNGLLEIIGLDTAKVTGGNLKILEFAAADGFSYQEVLNASSIYDPASVMDIDGNGQLEFVGITESSDNKLNILSFASRTGDSITEFYNSGTMFQEIDGNLNGPFLLGDIDGDGNDELAVSQGIGWIHILGVEVQVIEADIDIKPGSCPNPFNMDAKGVLPVAVLGNRFLDVTRINPYSLRLSGVPALRSSFEDVATRAGNEGCNDNGPDGVVDLALKFDRQQIAAALGDAGDRDVLTMELTGELNDGTSFRGEDVIVVILPDKNQDKQKGGKK